MVSIRRKLQPPSRNLPIITLIANAYESDIKRYHEAGATAYLAKPCRSELLMETVVDALKDHSATIRV
jgi:CheY-like chemotaxis protein